MAARPSKLVDQATEALKKALPNVGGSRIRAAAKEVILAVKRSHVILGQRDFKQRVADAVFKIKSCLRLLCKECRKNRAEWE